MPAKKQLLHSEFVYHPYQGGIKFSRPENGMQGQFTLQNIMQLSSDVCFISRDAKALLMNDPSILRTGMESFRDCVNKTIFDVATPKTAYIVTEHQQKIFKTKSLQIMEYDFARNDELIHHCLLFSMPWYQEDHQLGGILDLALVSGRDSFPLALTQLLQLGLLNNSSPAMNVSDDAFNQLSRRERECVKLLAEGKKSKQIGLMLGLSPRTVDHYLESAMTKFAVHSRYELVSKYMSILSMRGSRL